VNDHSERNHAKVSPSKLASLERCSHFKNRETDQPHPITLMGTRCHEALELYVNTRELLLDDCESEEEREYRIIARDYIVALGLHAKPWELIAEPKLWTHEKNTYGFADLVAIDRENEVAHIIDWKFGRNEQPDASENVQGWAYTLGVIGGDIRAVTVHFLYPALGQVSTHTFLEEDIPRLKDRISRINHAVELASRGELEPSYHRETCRWCAKASTCSAFQPVRETLSLGNKAPVPDSFDLQSLDSEQLGRLLDALAYFRDMEADVKNYCLTRDVDPAGYAVLSKKGRLSDIEDHKAAVDLAREFGLTDEEILACAKLSSSKLAKATRAHADRGKKMQAEEQFRNELIAREIVTMGEPTRYLKRTKENLIDLEDGFDIGLLKPQNP